MAATSTSESTDRDPRVAIVGGGPIGIELAVALKRRGLDCEIFEAGSIGHTISWWAPQTRWFSSNERIAIAGVPLLTTDQSKATREQYLTYLRGVVSQFDLKIRTHCPVAGIESGEKHFVLSLKPTSGHTTVKSDAVVLAVGGTDFPKRLGIDGENLPHVDGYLRETHRYYGRRVLVIGGRNSAIEAALRLHHSGAHVALSYRGEHLPEDGIKYWLLPEIKGLLKAGRIVDLIGTVPEEITPQGVRLRSIRTDEVFEYRVDDVLSLIGYEQDKTLMRAAGVALQGSTQRPFYDETTMETNVKGLYVAGTATAGTQTSKYKTFLENCHDHVDKIVAHLTGRANDTSHRAYQQQIVSQPES